MHSTDRCIKSVGRRGESVDVHYYFEIKHRSQMETQNNVYLAKGIGYWLEKGGFRN